MTSIPLYVPHIQLNDATRIFLAHSQAMGQDVRLVDVADDPMAYVKHLRSRWEERCPFINIEHDVVPWPGALESLEMCPQMWCAYGYDVGAQDFNPAPLGLVKFSAEFQAALPDLWLDDVPWHALDTHLWSYATERGHQAHQHRPSVLHASFESLVYLRRAEQTEL